MIMRFRIEGEAANMEFFDLTLPGIRNNYESLTLSDVDLMRDTLSYLTDWLPLMYSYNKKPLYADSHWDVAGMFRYYSSSNSFLTMTLSCHRRMQGYVVCRVDYNDCNGVPCLYLQSIAAAPWNRNVGKRTPRIFRHIGRSLVACMCIIGVVYNDTPAIETHATQNALPFYSEVGFHPDGQLENDTIPLRLPENKGYDLIRLIRPHVNARKITKPILDNQTIQPRPDLTMSDIDEYYCNVRKSFLKTVREMRNLTIHEAAVKTGLEEGHIRRLESGDVGNGDIEALNKISKEYSVDSSKLAALYGIRDKKNDGELFHASYFDTSFDEKTRIKIHTDFSA